MTRVFQPSRCIREQLARKQGINYFDINLLRQLRNLVCTWYVLGMYWYLKKQNLIWHIVWNRTQHLMYINQLVVSLSY